MSYCTIVPFTIINLNTVLPTSRDTEIFKSEFMFVVLAVLKFFLHFCIIFICFYYLLCSFRFYFIFYFKSLVSTHLAIQFHLHARWQ